MHSMNYSLRANHKNLLRRQPSATNSSNISPRFAIAYSVTVSDEERGHKKRELVGNFKNAGSSGMLSGAGNDHDSLDSTGETILTASTIVGNRGSVFSEFSDTSAFAAHPSPAGGNGKAHSVTRAANSILADTVAAIVVDAMPGRRTPSAALQPFALAVRGSLSDGHFQMESHRTSLVFRNLQELGRRTVEQLSEDSQLPSQHHNQDG